VTATVPQLRHPSWCDTATCPSAAVAAGMPHQSRELPVVVDGVKHGAVVLQQHRNGPVQVSFSMRGLAWPPEVAEALADALVRAARRARAEA
jgi:hypothetical protein